MATDEARGTDGNVVAWFERVSWRMPGWTWEFRPLQFGDRPLRFGDPMVYAGHLVLIAHTKNSYDGHTDVQVEHMTPVPAEMPIEMMPQLFRQAYRAALSHEGDEWFRLDSVMVFDPHADILTGKRLSTEFDQRGKDHDV